MKLYLIRHGQTDWNVCGKIQGSLDIPLNATGKAQARLLAAAMEKRPVDWIFSSPLSRALNTAKVIGEKKGLEVHLAPDLREVEFGCWEGLSKQELQERYPQEYERWKANPSKTTPPGGETWEEAAKRAIRALRWVLSAAGGEGALAIVSHGATLAHLVTAFVENPAEAGFIMGNASITTVAYEPLTGRFQIEAKNDMAHLT